MPKIPKHNTLDSTLELLADPYRFIGKTARLHHTDVFQTRLLLEPTICMTGPAAAELFYDSEHFQRRGAAPSLLVKTLFGKGGVQGLDGQAHLHRRRMFLELTTPQRAEQLAENVREVWLSEAQAWTRRSQPFALYPALRRVLTIAVCRWAGVPLPAEQVDPITDDLSALFNKAACADWRHLESRWARQRADRWAAGLIKSVRSKRLLPAPESPLHVVAHHRDLQGELLSPKVAGVELLNLLRPVVAVAVYMVFVAHALHRYPESRPEHTADDPQDEADRIDRAFVQEVRRLYPFFPAVAAKVKESFSWGGFDFPQGRRVLLDLYGTNHDPRAWDEPQRFDPDRYQREAISLFNHIAQGGGQRETDHRCPGEPIAIRLMEVALQVLTTNLTYRVPTQDLELDMRRLPSQPPGGFLIDNVKVNTHVTAVPPAERT